MSYVPGTIAALFGIYELIRALTAKNPETRRGFFIRAGIDFAIAIGLVLLNTYLNRQ